MLQGKRESEWNQTASLILVMQKLAGLKNARFQNPFSETGESQDEKRKKLKQIIRGSQNAN